VAESKTKLFVGGISWGTTDAGLRDAFAKFGVLRTAQIVTDRETGRSRGFGFVEYDKEDDARHAQSAMDGVQIDGRSVRVSMAEDKGRSGGGGGGTGGGFDNRPPRQEYRPREDRDGGGNHPPVGRRRS